MERRKERRISVELPGTFRVRGQDPRTMFFSQISAHGCRLAAEDMGLGIGESVEVYLGAVGPIGAVVRWIAENSAGVEFDVALDEAVVAYFAVFIDAVA